ncbi:hypothetical protein NFI96_004446 [Prochilodus magdalenae]|nr:hypothetical protein NFI96_004446 [Prochilodus magdalenae]
MAQFRGEFPVGWDYNDGNIVCVVCVLLFIPHLITSTPYDGQVFITSALLSSKECRSLSGVMTAAVWWVDSGAGLLRKASIFEGLSDPAVPGNFAGTSKPPKRRRVFTERSLGCILCEMGCLKHAFEGHNFLSVVLKIVEGPTPSLPEEYSAELNALMQRMLEKNPSCRISAAEALSSSIVKELSQVQTRLPSALLCSHIISHPLPERRIAGPQ